MRHAVAGRKLNRTSSHRKAMLRNMVQSLFEHGEIRTTIPKAKEARRFAERLITLAVNGSLAARQRAIALLNDRQIVRKENQDAYDALSDAARDRALRSRSGRRYRAATTRPGVPFTTESVIHKLFAEIGPAQRERNEKLGSSGGYTRIIKLANRRLGDGGQLAILQVCTPDDEQRSKNSDKTNRKRRATVKYAVYAGKPRPTPRRRGGGKKTTDEDAAATTAVAEAPAKEEPTTDEPEAKSEQTKPEADES